MLERLPKNCVCAEIGVWKGEFSREIFEVIEPRKLHLIDPWAFDPAFPDRWYGGKKATSQADMDAIWAAVTAQFQEHPNVLVHRKRSTDAALCFPDGHFRWVYIDGDHSYEAVLNDLRAWSPKIKKDGFIVGDDFNWRDELGQFSVRRAVVQFADEMSLPLKLVQEGQFLIRV